MLKVPFRCGAAAFCWQLDSKHHCRPENQICPRKAAAAAAAGSHRPPLCWGGGSCVLRECVAALIQLWSPSSFKNNIHLNAGELELISVVLPWYLQFSNKGLITLFIFCAKHKVAFFFFFFVKSEPRFDNDAQTPFEQLEKPGGIYLVWGSQGAGVQVHRRSALPPTPVLSPLLGCSRRRSAAVCLAQTRALDGKSRG